MQGPITTTAACTLNDKWRCLWRLYRGQAFHTVIKSSKHGQAGGRLQGLDAENSFWVRSWLFDRFFNGLRRILTYLWKGAFWRSACCNIERFRKLKKIKVLIFWSNKTYITNKRKIVKVRRKITRKFTLRKPRRTKWMPH